ncbi:MAG: hypothetical protein KAQ99_08705 [Candidatus Aureabacteria bacterium]|nr:hypothetical protein [Candidatus Auribacterota bacterium]
MPNSLIVPIITIIISVAILIIGIMTFQSKVGRDTKKNNNAIYLRQDKIKDKINFEIDKLEKDSRGEFMNAKACDRMVLTHRENFQRMERQLEVGFKSINDTISGLNSNIIELAKKNGKD